MRQMRFNSLVLAIAVATGMLMWEMVRAEPVYAQGLGSTATLTGQITDQSGAVMPGVQLSLLNLAGGGPITMVSNEAGYYQFPYLRPATHALTAKIMGFGDVS